MGPSWGDHEYGEMSLDYVQRYHHETFVTRHARWAPSPEKSVRLREAGENPKEVRRVWGIENPRFRYVVRGRRRSVEVTQYYIISPTFGSPVTCFELKTGFGLRVGWAFLRHSSGSSKFSEITELYVWPIYRRMGFGRALEELAAEEAQNHGSSEIRLLMNESEAILGPPRTAARKFADACDYTLRWRSTVAPRARATGIKAIYRG